MATKCRYVVGCLDRDVWIAVRRAHCARDLNKVHRCVSPIAARIRHLSLRNINAGIIGDTKAGTYIGTDRFGNKYYENMDELPCTFCRIIV